MDEMATNEQTKATERFTWQASEYIHHDKRAGWYAIFALIVLIGCGLLIWKGMWSELAVLVVMSAVIVKYARREPAVLNYHLDKDGLTIENKFYPYSQFRSFGVVQDVGWHAIDLEPVQRFMFRVQLMIDDKDLDTVVSYLSAELPREDHEPDLIDRIARNLHF
jgi:hypothetical protein